jgi:serine/threonine protein kinase
MLVPEGGKMQPKVLDFGTARADVETLRSGGQSIGAGFTPLYASPEQWDPSRGDVGPRSDVYALGLTLAEMCLLAHPFPAPESLSAIMHDTLDESRRPRIAAARPDLPADVEAVILRALRVRPELRQANARELLAELRAALKTSPVTAPLALPIALPPTAAIVTAPLPVPHVAPSRTNRLPWILAGTFLAIALAAIVAGVFAALRLAEPKASPPGESATP